MEAKDLEPQKLYDDAQARLDEAVNLARILHTLKPNQTVLFVFFRAHIYEAEKTLAMLLEAATDSSCGAPDAKPGDVLTVDAVKLQE